MAWDLFLTDEVDRWLDDLATSDADSYAQVVAGIDLLAAVGPSLGRPLVGGDKSGNWTRWYFTAIPRAERLYEE
ncbi:MAG: DNA-binding protein, partial [Actinobacteria bacterium]|nr:DNA-binding protein [Actinomycetota bacterium]